MGTFLPVAAGTAILASALVVASPVAPAAAVSCAPASVWANSWDDGTGTGTIQRFTVDPATGDLTTAATIPAARVYGDIAIATEDGELWGTDFLPVPSDDHAFFRIDPASGAEIARVEIEPSLDATVGDARELNSLSFLPDGRLYTAAGWSRNVYIVDPADGSWGRPTVESIPILEAGWDDHFPAGDFLTLESGEVLAVANAQQDVTDPSTIVSYLVVFDFDAHTVRIPGRFSHWVNGAAQSGPWIFFAGQLGGIQRLAIADIPADDDPARDLTGLVATAFDLPGGRWFGIASPQDSGGCPVAVTSGDDPQLAATGSPTPGMLALGAAALLGAGMALRRARAARSRA